MQEPDAVTVTVSLDAVTVAVTTEVMTVVDGPEGELAGAEVAGAELVGAGGVGSTVSVSTLTLVVSEAGLEEVTEPAGVDGGVEEGVMVVM